MSNKSNETTSVSATNSLNLNTLNNYCGLTILKIVLSAVSLVAAVSVFATMFCNTDIMVDCAKLGAGCSGPSPNCPGQGNYTGTVSHPGNRLLVKAADSGWYDVIPLGNCSFTCLIGPDCTGQYVNITLLGGTQAMTDWSRPCP